MVYINQTVCPKCGGKLIFYDNVNRIVRTKYRKTYLVKIRRVKCLDCKMLHRELPRFIFPYKQYESEVINGVIEGLITPDTLGFEDYPCEMTMLRWKTQNLHGAL